MSGSSRGRPGDGRVALGLSCPVHPLPRLTAHEQRIASNHKFLLDNKLVEPGKVTAVEAYNLTFIKDAKVMP